MLNTTTRCLRTLLVAAAVTVAGAPQPSMAQDAPIRKAGRGVQVAQVPDADRAAADVPVDEPSADQTREELYQLLDKYPPVVGRVFKLEPALMTNEAYVSAYPGLAAFLDRHPEVARNAAFFLERIPIAAGGSWEWDRAMQERRQTQEVLAGIAAFFVFLVVTSVVVWLVRTVIEHRRWNRVSKTQFDVHNKLLERFSTTDELLAYIQTPVGRRFLESGPAPVPGESRPVGAPFSRILWSVQVGTVLLAASAGLLFLSAKTDADPSLFFMVFGVIALAIGVGFIGSGGAAWLVAARLGLIDRRDSHDA